MSRKPKRDSGAVWIMFFAICALLILGASGCIFEDVQDDRTLVAACVIIFAGLLAYATKVYAEHFASEPDDRGDYDCELP